MALRCGRAVIILSITLLFITTASAESTIKIGLILPYTGQLADVAAQIDSGIRLYLKQNGNAVAGKTIEILRRDVGGPAPDIAKRIAQELIVRDNVDILAGFAFTPNALAAAEVSAQAKKLMVVMNAATGIVTTKSPYIVRTSSTLQQSTEPLGSWAAKNGFRHLFTMVTDYAPGHEAEAAFIRSFKEGGGEIIGSVRLPVAGGDFSPYVQRAKDVKPDAIYVFVPGGAQPPALTKSLADRGVDGKQIKILGQGEIADESALKSAGEAAIGIITVYNYDYSLDSNVNKEFVRAYNEAFGRNPDVFSVGGYDGMKLIFTALEKTGGAISGDELIAAAKQASWESPRGPVRIDPATRELIQTMYIRRVERVDGQLKNVVLEKVENVEAKLR